MKGFGFTDWGIPGLEEFARASRSQMIWGKALWINKVRESLLIDSLRLFGNLKKGEGTRREPFLHNSIALTLFLDLGN